MKSSDDGPRVVDARAESRFVVRDEGQVAELVYRLEDGRLVLVHTGVPEALGGRGIGGRLVQAAVERAAREHLTVVPWCPFVRRWLHDHADVADTIDVDWHAPPPAEP